MLPRAFGPTAYILSERRALMLHGRNSRGFAFILLLALLVSCSRYTEQEKGEYQHFLKGQGLFEIVGGNARSLPGLANLSIPQQSQQIFLLLEVQGETKQVRDNTLSLIHPELPDKYRTIFIPWIETELKAYRELDVEASSRGTKLRNDWVDWWSKNKSRCRKIE
jgi:hypothetical protein